LIKGSILNSVLY